MNDPTVKISVQDAVTGELANSAASANSDMRAVPPSAIRIALTVRTRKVVRLAPPIDSGFRPFRVF